MSTTTVATEAAPTMAPKNRLVVRLLPPQLQEQEFMSLVGQSVDEATCEHRYYVPGKLSRKSKPPTYSRAYITFKDAKSLKTFYRGFKVLSPELDKLYPDICDARAKVEYAPMQEAPENAATKPGAPAGKLEDDPIYQNFLSHLKDDKVELMSLREPVKEIPLKPDQNENNGKKKKESKSSKNKKKKDKKEEQPKTTPNEQKKQQGDGQQPHAAEKRQKKNRSGNNKNTSNTTQQENSNSGGKSKKKPEAKKPDVSAANAAIERSADELQRLVNSVPPLAPRADLEQAGNKDKNPEKRKRVRRPKSAKKQEGEATSPKGDLSGDAKKPEKSGTASNNSKPNNRSKPKNNENTTTNGTSVPK